MARAKFSSHEIISPQEIRAELTGDPMRPDVDDVAFREIHRRTGMRLEMGERVVVDAANLRRRDRSGLLDLAFRCGVPVFYVVCDRQLDLKLKDEDEFQVLRQDQTFKASEREILHGDGMANVIDTRVDEFQVVERLPLEGLTQAIKDRGFRGLMVIGDVHGMIEPLKNATEWATSRNLFCVLLGDIVDYGPDSIDCVGHAYDLVTRGRGVTVIGNHERKIERWLDQSGQSDSRIRLSEGNKTTTRVVEAMPHDTRRRFEIRYRALLNHARHHWVIGDTLFSHAAASPEMFQLHRARLQGKLESLSLFGQIDSQEPKRSDGYPNRVYDWVDQIPSGKRVMVGHDIRSTTRPLVVKGDEGGEAYFMDTGCGKGGRLTSADVIFQNARLVIRSFKTH